MRPEQCKLTATQEKLWSDTRVALLWHCPAFSHIFYTMLNNAGSQHVALFTKDVPIAATDGSNLLLNPDTFFKYNLMERVFVCAHEIMHCVWNHLGLMHGFLKRGKVPYPDGTYLPYDPATMNIATDLVINDLLIESKIGAFNKDWLHDTNIANSKDSAIDAYKKVFQQNPPGKGGGGEGPSGKGFDEHLAPGTSQGKDPTSAANERNESKWQTEVSAAASAAKAQGKMPAALDRWFGEILNPVVDWKDKVRGMVARRVGTGGYDWRKADRRLIVRDIVYPGRSGYGCGTIVVAGDTSGSIDYATRKDGRQSTGDMFFAEMAGIFEDCRPQRLIIMWCDAAVGRVDEAEDPSDLNVIRHKGVPGGGGTSFVPVFDEIANMGLEPDALIYLTDGLGTFPSKEPSYPVIWGNIYPQAKYPFGDVVDIPKQAA
jgi:predicted metal-dependent peptidase